MHVLRVRNKILAIKSVLQVYMTNANPLKV